jgi:hypothetical protein
MHDLLDFSIILYVLPLIYFFLKDPAIADFRFSLVGRIFTKWPSDQGIIKEVIKRKKEKYDRFAQNLAQTTSQTENTEKRKTH